MNNDLGNATVASLNFAVRRRHHVKIVQVLLFIFYSVMMMKYTWKSLNEAEGSYGIVLDLNLEFVHKAFERSLELKRFHIMYVNTAKC